MNKFDSTRFIANLTPQPGVYRFLDAEGVVLYVGKASNLQKRVSSYFSKQNSGVKTRSLVNQIATIEVSVTRNNTEALLLESNLIKNLRPKYNVLLRDDKSYPYIHVSASNPFPRMELYRSKKKPKKGIFLGPYPSATAVRETLGTIQKVFKIRNCRDSYFNTRSRPCLQYQIKRCTAPCTGYISAEAYQLSVADALRFLQGKSLQILTDLAKRMEQAVERLDFEQAAVLRDQIKNLRLIQGQQSIIQLRGEADVIAIEAKAGFACIQCVTVREGRVLSNQSFFPTVPQQSLDASDSFEADLWQQVFTAFIAHYYVEIPERIPDLLVTHEPIGDHSALEAMLRDLRGKKCKILTNPRGSKAGWLDFAMNNLRVAVAEYAVSASTMSRRYEALNNLLHPDKPISRMECFDISHTQGQATVASCVVFNQNGPKKSEYRQFIIENITPGDDYAAIEQALNRRLKKLLAENNLPDVLLIDGGKGQISVAKRVLTELKITEVLLLGLAKGRDRKAGYERLILAEQVQEVSLPMDSPAFHLLQHIRDEAHRFAITAHRKKRQRVQLDSSLLTIDGVGPKRRRALLAHFGGLRELSKASVAEIAKVNGINSELASRIFVHFHS